VNNLDDEKKNNEDKKTNAITHIKATNNCIQNLKDVKKV